MQFGMPTLIENPKLEESALLCKELGLDFIELNMNLLHYQIEFLENVERFSRVAEQYGIFYTIHLDENFNVCDFNRAVTKAYLQTVEKTIEVAKRLKVPVINMHMNKGVYFTLPDQRIYLFDWYRDNYRSDIRTFQALCEEVIQDTDIKITIENTDGYLSYEQEAIEDLLQSETFALTWDIGHSYSANEVDEPFLLQHMRKIRHFHLHDATRAKNHLVLGSGEINIEERMKIAIATNSRCVIETKTIEALRESVAYMRANHYMR